jgi:rod shape-determining protein MreC
MQPPPGGLAGSRESQYQNHIANLQQQLRKQQQKFKKLSGLHNRFAFEGAAFVIADISRTVIDGSHSELIINRGENDGLVKGQFVLGDNSVIGTISDVSPRMAKVRLITDLASKIEVTIAGTERLMAGSGNNSAKVHQLLRKKHKVSLGDKVFTLSKPGLLAVPMVVGKVIRCGRDDANPLLWDIMVEPACEIETLKDVAVIVMNPQ